MVVRLVTLFAVFLFSVAGTAAAGTVPVQLAWDAPHDPQLVAGYRVHVGTSPGKYTSTIDVAKNVSYAFSGGTVGVRYYFAISAYNAAGAGPLTSEVSAVILSDGAPTPTPNPNPNPGPGGIVLSTPVVKGSSVTLSWAVDHNAKVAEYTLEAGTRSGLSDVFNGPVGAVTTVTGNVGQGTFFVRVRGRTRDDQTLTSNEQKFTIGSGGTCTAPPAAPSRPTGSIRNGVATVSWAAVAGATSYIVQAGSDAALSNLFSGDVGPYTSVSADVPEGFRAHVRVMAVNGCGQSIASEEITIR
jgi:hypothetical protein